MNFNGSSQSVITNVSAYFDDDLVEVEVEPGQGHTGIANFTGFVTCNSNEPEVYVNLRVQAGGLNATIDPETMTFRYGESDTQTFVATVQAFMGSTAQDRQVNVDGDWQSTVFVGSVNGDNTSMRFMQYFDVSIWIPLSPSEHLGGSPGENCDFTLWIHNQGNGRDVLEVEITNQLELEGMGFDLPWFDPESLHAHEVHDYDIRLVLPNVKDECSIEFRVRSQRAGENGSELSYSVNETIYIGTSPPANGGGGDSGSDSDEMPFFGPEALIAVAVCLIIIRRPRHLSRR